MSLALDARRLAMLEAMGITLVLQIQQHNLYCQLSLL